MYPAKVIQEKSTATQQVKFIIDQPSRAICKEIPLQNKSVGEWSLMASGHLTVGVDLMQQNWILGQEKDEEITITFLDKVAIVLGAYLALFCHPRRIIQWVQTIPQ